MNVPGRECTITLKTMYTAIGLPYSEETIREAISLMKEEAPLEGNGVCKAIRKRRGVTGCVITPLHIETAPLLLTLALGCSEHPVFVSETRVLYRHSVTLLPMESGQRFDLIQERGHERTLYEGCRVRGFELRMMQEAAIKLKLDICNALPGLCFGDYPPVSWQSPERAVIYDGERFMSNRVRYLINGNEYTALYGLTIAVRRAGGTQTEVRIHRIHTTTTEFPQIIETLEITAQLLTDNYAHRLYGAFHLTLSRLVLMSDETAINSGDTVIGALRYYCGGGMSAVVFNTSEEIIQ
jgi:hypothetical protein